MRIQILKKSLSSFWLGVFMKSPYFLILDDNKLGKDCLSFNRAYILIYIFTWKLKINKCILFTTIYWENFFSHWIFVPFLDKVKKMCISKRAKWILIWVLMLLVKLVIHFINCCCWCCYFSSIMNKAINTISCSKYHIFWTVLLELNLSLIIRGQLKIGEKSSP